MNRFTPLWDDVLHTAWWRFVRLWRPMALWTLVVFLLFGSFLGPLLSGGARRAIFRGDYVMVGNEDLLFWLLQPEGLGYASIAGALVVMGGVLRYAGLFVIIRDDVIDSTVSVRQTLFGILPDLPALFKLCLLTVLATIVLVLPLLLGAGVFYIVWLTDHDINYYLYAKPPAWYRALNALGVWAFFWAMGAGYVVLRTILALPAYLDGHRPVTAAVRRSWQGTGGDAWRILGIVASGVAAWFALRGLASASFYVLSGMSIDFLLATTSSVTPIILLTGGWLAGSLLMDAVLSFVGFSMVATVLTKFYFEDTDLHSTLPGRSMRGRRLPRRAMNLARRWIYPHRLVPLLGVLLLCSFVASALLLEVGEDPPAFEVAAHRAGAFLAPENTLAALERSIEAGADYAEIDVQMTPDSVLVVAHDADLMRIAGDASRFSETPFTEIQGTILGEDDSIPDDERMLATLGEFMERADGRIDLMIEPKYYGPDSRLAAAIVEEVQAREMEDQVVLLALDMAAIRQIQQVAPDLQTGYLASVTMGDITRLPVDLLAVSHPLATSELIAAAHARGKPVHVWTLNRVSTMLQAISRGADGIITDDPILAIQLRTELAELSTTERLLLQIRPHAPGIVGLDDEGKE